MNKIEIIFFNFYTDEHSHTQTELYNQQRINRPDQWLCGIASVWRVFLRGYGFKPWPGRTEDFKI